jgi:D-serine dehydratase
MRNTHVIESQTVAAKGLSTVQGPVLGVSALDERLATPLMVVRRSALNSNIDLLAKYCSDRNVFLAPHAKTTMTPEIIQRQLAAGAWGITTANVSQAIALGNKAGSRVLIANEVVDTGGIRWLNEAVAKKSPKIYCYVDSLKGVERIASGITSGILDVLLEVGISGGRCGVRTIEEALAVARGISEVRSLRLVGVATFEGIVAVGARDAAAKNAVRECLEHARRVAVALSANKYFKGIDDVILSAGGSAYFDIVADVLSTPIEGVHTRVVLRSGCYVTHDHNALDLVTPFRPPSPTFRAAIEVLSSVLSCPERGLAICDIGRRDVPFDAGLPTPLWRRARRDGCKKSVDGIEVARLNDQHGYLRVSGRNDVAVGDVIGFGISHPCTAFDKWRVIPLVDDDLVITELLHTLF